MGITIGNNDENASPEEVLRALADAGITLGGNITFGGSVVFGDQVGMTGGIVHGDLVMGSNPDKGGSNALSREDLDAD